MIRIVHAQTPQHFEYIRRLFIRYADALGFDLEFQNFNMELATLPGEYAQPRGCLLLGRDSGNWVGCVALRGIEDFICEMKRLYVIPEYRGQGIGRILARAIINAAREKGYQKMRLDTIKTMQEARTLYSTLGFYTIEPYCFNPIAGASYMELKL